MICTASCYEIGGMLCALAGIARALCNVKRRYVNDAVGGCACKIVQLATSQQRSLRSLDRCG